MRGVVSSGSDDDRKAGWGLPGARSSPGVSPAGGRLEAGPTSWPCFETEWQTPEPGLSRHTLAARSAREGPYSYAGSFFPTGYPLRRVGVNSSSPNASPGPATSGAA
jgi:hypothetical protein